MKNQNIVILFFLILSTTISAQTNYKYPRGILTGEDEAYEQMEEKTEMTRSAYQNLPSTFSIKKYAPIPKSQGSYGTCAGWAVGYAARTILEAQKYEWTDKAGITTNAFSATFQYRATERRRRTCKGAYTAEVVASLKDIGSIKMLNFQTSDGNVMCPTAPMPDVNYEGAGKNKIPSHARLWSSSYKNSKGKIARTKKSISQEMPVVISMICPNSFDDLEGKRLWRPHESPYGNVGGRDHGRHAMCVVGYDDNKYGGAFEVQNSWGTDWGNNGYIWIRYKDFSRFVYQAFELQKLPKPKPKEPLFAGKVRIFDMENDENLDISLNEIYRNLSAKRNSYKSTYKVSKSLPSGSAIRFYIESNQSAYVYILGTGSVDKSFNQLFPVDGISPLLNYKDAEVAIPSEEHYFEMDNTIGKDYIIVIFSKEKLNIESIEKQMEKTNGELLARLNSVLYNEIVPIKSVDFKRNKVEFQVQNKGDSKDLFAFVIEMDHI